MLLCHDATPIGYYPAACAFRLYHPAYQEYTIYGSALAFVTRENDT